jgi:serine/threonine-protein kinase
VKEAFALLAPAIDGIAHAHEQGFAHLSLDPWNLFLDHEEGPSSLKVLDFGTARSNHRADARPTLDSELTRGLHLLRPAYASPEQLDMDLGDPGPWTDVYALALIMMEVLAQRSQVEKSDTAALVDRALDRHNRPTPQSHGLKLPPPLDLVLTRAVARNPRKRQENARVFLNELKVALSHGAAANAPAPPKRVAQPPAPTPVPLPAPLPSPPPSLPVMAPPVPLPPSSAASLSIATRDFLPQAAPDPAPMPMDGEEKFVAPRRPFVRAAWLVPCAAGLAFAVIVATVLALWHARQPSANQVATATPARAAPPAVASVTPPTATATATAVAPPTPAPVASLAKAAPTPPVAARPVAPGIAAAPMHAAAIPHAVVRPALLHFSYLAAQRALLSVTGKVRKCRRGRTWGDGYATVIFGSDGSVKRVLVDPPFSMTVTGKCVADALGLAHMRSFGDHKGYYRLHFYIAKRS